jgi:hypothetical protein
LPCQRGLTADLPKTASTAHKATSYQARVDADRATTSLDNSSRKSIKPKVLRKLASTARDYLPGTVSGAVSRIVSNWRRGRLSDSKGNTLILASNIVRIISCTPIYTPDFLNREPSATVALEAKC